MPLVRSPAIVLAAFRYGETSKIARLATREHGVQSAIAKGASRPKSRYGAALQVLSEGTAHYYAKEGRELHTLADFEVARVRVGLAERVGRYAAASALAEAMLRLAPGAPHPSSYAVLSDALDVLELAPEPALDVLALRAMWRLVAVLGFGPEVERCARDGAALPADGAAFSLAEGGTLCEACARLRPAQAVPAEALEALAAFTRTDRDLPALDERHAAAHRRLLARWIRHHAGERTDLPALEFWLREGRPA